MTSKSMNALKSTGPGKTEVQNVPLPRLRDDYVLVKVTAVALNPTDWKHVHHVSTPGATVGCDLAGIVEEVGSKVNQAFKKGERISGFTHGVNAVEKEDGAFAQYAVVKGDLAIPIPDKLSDQEVATLGVGISTVGQGLYQSLELPLPGSGKFGGFVLVYGGSTATGTLAIQFAKLSGADVITTCSPRNFDLVKGLGAVEAFDYSDPDCAKKIRDFTQDSLTKAFDCISEGASPKICEDAISSKGGEISYLLQCKHERQDVKLKYTLAYSITGEGFKLGGKDFPAQPQDYEFGKKFWALSARLLADGQIKVHPLEVRDGGLGGVAGGLDDMKEGRVSGKKLVYKIA